jgi:hypothetical protein
MAFTDPQSITVDGVATSLPRVLTGTTVGSFKSADAVKEVTIDPRGSAKRRRNVVRFYSKRNTVDPLNPAISITSQSMVSVTIDRPLTGAIDADIEKDLLGLIGWLTASTNANLKKLVAGEN